MQKAIALVNQDPVLLAFSDQLESLAKLQKQRFDFLEKQLNDTQKDGNKQNDVLWDGLIEHLRAQGKLPDDYTKDKYHFHMDKGESVIFICNGDHLSNENKFIQMIRQAGFTPPEGPPFK